MDKGEITLMVKLLSLVVRSAPIVGAVLTVVKTIRDIKKKPKIRVISTLGSANIHQPEKSSTEKATQTLVQYSVVSELENTGETTTLKDAILHAYSQQGVLLQSLKGVLNQFPKTEDPLAIGLNDHKHLKFQFEGSWADQGFLKNIFQIEFSFVNHGNLIHPVAMTIQE